jgi:hypothetical protein
MIIRRHPDTLVFIEQADHARLAAGIIAAWRPDGFPSHPRRASVLLAAREHDNGWAEEDAATHVDAAGGPLDFMSVPPSVKQRIWPRAAARLADADPYAAALVAQHALALHGQQRADPAWRTFLATMERVKSDLLRRCDPSTTETLAADYIFVQRADQLSLIFCNAWTAPFPLPGGRAILNGTTLTIAPDPFDGTRIPLRVPARRLPARTFDSPSTLRRALDAAPVEHLDGDAVGDTAHA